jgi:hypothetical protein
LSWDNGANWYPFSGELEAGRSLNSLGLTWSSDFKFRQVCENDAYRFQGNDGCAAEITVTRRTPPDLQCWIGVWPPVIEAGQPVNLYVNGNPPSQIKATNILNESGANPYVKTGLPAGNWSIWGLAQDAIGDDWKTCAAGTAVVLPSDDVASMASDHSVDGQQKICLNYRTGQVWNMWASNKFYCSNHWDFKGWTVSGGELKRSWGAAGCYSFPSGNRLQLPGDWSGVSGANPTYARTGCQKGCGGRDGTVLNQSRPDGNTVCVGIDDGEVGNQPGAVDIHIDWNLTR